MEQDFNLYQLIIKSVEKQIEDNEPPVTRKTFQRLVANGHSEGTAKEMIAQVIAEEIYFMMSDDRVINEDFFAERLSRLQ